MVLAHFSCFQSGRTRVGNLGIASRISRDQTGTRIPSNKDVIVDVRRQVRQRHDNIHFRCDVQLPRTGRAAAGGAEEGGYLVIEQRVRYISESEFNPFFRSQFEAATRFFAEEGRSVDADDFFGMFETFLTSFATSRIELDRFAREKEVEEKRLQAETQVRDLIS